MRGRRVLSTARRRLLGLAFVALNFALVLLAVAIYLQVFGSTVPVTVRADHVGNQLQRDGDVKVRGVIVGQIRAVRPTRDGAEIELALDPDRAALVPANVSARLTPKTLFGERFVDLVLPPRPSAEPLRAGAVIPQDRSETAIELERVLNNLLPVLQAVEPHKLAAALGALDQALAGRGEQLGRTLVQLHEYLDQFNPALPQLQANLRELAQAGDTLAGAAPDLLAAMSNLTTTSRTVVEQKVALERMFSSLTHTSGDLLGYLVANRDNLIGVAETSRPTLELAARYSPSIACFLENLAGLVPLANKAFGAGTDRPALRVVLEVAPSRGKYVPNQDEPEFTDDRGPVCYQPMPFPQKFPQYPGGPPRDGAEHPPPPAGQGSAAPAFESEPAFDGEPAWDVSPAVPAVHRPRAIDGWDLGVPNSPQEAEFVAFLKAPAFGLPPERVPGWAALLLGPTLRGAEVTVR